MSLFRRPSSTFKTDRHQHYTHGTTPHPWNNSRANAVPKEEPCIYINTNALAVSTAACVVVIAFNLRSYHSPPPHSTSHAVLTLTSTTSPSLPWPLLYSSTSNAVHSYLLNDPVPIRRDRVRRLRSPLLAMPVPLPVRVPGIGGVLPHLLFRPLWGWVVDVLHALLNVRGRRGSKGG